MPTVQDSFWLMPDLVGYAGVDDQEMRNTIRLLVLAVVAAFRK